jgi:hypothetical protein
LHFQPPARLSNNARRLKRKKRIQKLKYFLLLIREHEDFQRYGKKIRIGLIKTKGEKISGPKVSKRLRATASSPSPFEVILPHLIRFDLFLTTSCFPKKKNCHCHSPTLKWPGLYRRTSHPLAVGCSLSQVPLSLSPSLVRHMLTPNAPTFSTIQATSSSSSVVSPLPSPNPRSSLRLPLLRTGDDQLQYISVLLCLKTT